jgi:hypothetical protein
MRGIVQFAGCIVMFAGTALAQQKDEPQRQLGAHEHGAGKLGIAFERRTVEMEFEIPAYDIVGFEHAAKTPEQKQAISQARALLSKPLTLVKLPDAAGCKVVSSKVKLVGGGAHSHSHGHNHGKANTAKSEAETHSEFHAEYKLNCAKPELIQSIELDFFKSFPRAQKLEVSVVDEKAQTKSEATREKPRIDLKRSR